MAPRAKVSPNKQIACEIKQLSIVFNQENIQLSKIFFHQIGKMEYVRISDLVKS